MPKKGDQICSNRKLKPEDNFPWQACSGDSCESSAVGGGWEASQIGQLKIEKGGRMGQKEGWAGSCTIDNIENKKVDASEIISG